MVAELRTFSVDGVEVRHLPSDDEVCAVQLVFGAGTRDEQLHEQGVLQALEHVVMRELRLTPLEINAHVDHSHTEFVVAGDPVLVAGYLVRLCQGLNAPPVDRLSAEAPIIAAELGQDEGAHQPLLVRRYGLRDLGNQAVPGPGPDGLQAHQLVAAAARWFTAGNAFLLVDGPLPPDLALPLREGGRPTHVRVPPRPVAEPSAVRVDGPACMASLLLPPTDPAHLSEVAVELVDQRIQETVRHRDSLSYVVEVNVFDNVVHADGPDGHDLFVMADPPEEHLVRAVTVLVGELRALLRGGPSAAELSLAVERVVQRRYGRDGLVGAAHTTGIDALLGFARPPFDAEVTRTLTVEQVSAYLQPLETSLLVAVPDLPEIDLVTLGLREDHSAPTNNDPLPDGRRFRPPLFARAISSAARQAELRLTAEGLHCRLEGETKVIDWTNVVGVLVEDDHEAAVFAADGTHIQIGGAVWRDGDTLIREARAHVPPHLFYRASTLLHIHDDDH
ncbi:hypothetical protein [uncultured Friedmanniella sp.]|uniref:hypothetical protein n=1 Tax=uncultured Friedmanniella sp. TaxID=335381 RepID=UPI0035CAC9DE